MELKNKQKEKVKKLLTELNSSQISYVVLRKYDKLPDEAIGGDIDILTEDTNKVVEIGKNLGFKESRYDFKQNLVEIFRKLVSNPISLLDTLVSNPIGSIKRVLNEDITTPSLVSVEEQKIYFDGLMIHITDRVHYQSTLDDSRILASETVNTSMLEHTRIYECEDFVFNVASKPDELCHLVARGLFDYEGNFPNYYREKCLKLYSQLSEEERVRLNRLMSEVFFDASSIVVSDLENQDLDNLKSDLLSYSDY